MNKLMILQYQIRLGESRLHLKLKGGSKVEACLCKEGFSTEQRPRELVEELMRLCDDIIKELDNA